MPTLLKIIIFILLVKNKLNLKRTTTLSTKLWAIVSKRRIFSIFTLSYWKKLKYSNFLHVLKWWGSSIGSISMCTDLISGSLKPALWTTTSFRSASIFIFSKCVSLAKNTSENLVHFPTATKIRQKKAL